MRFSFLATLFKVAYSSTLQPVAAYSFKKKAVATRLERLEKIAVVSDTIYPYKRGRIYFQASWWPAVCEQNVVLPRGTPVRVIGIWNITYMVEPFASTQANDGAMKAA